MVVAPARSRFMTAVTLSSGMVKMTVMGWSWLSSTIPFVSPGVT